MEERQKIEEEERQRREEEERIKREEEERLKREAGERQRERQKKLDEEKFKREMERQMQEAEAREMERRRKEEEARAKRKDPNNWEPIVYNRPCDEVGGKKAFHSGVCCMVAAPPGNIAREDVECNASDELDDVIEILDDGEKPVSSIINIESKKGLVKSECPSRVYIPHCPVNSSSDELVLKVSVNGSDWETAGVVSPTRTMSENKRNIPVSNLVGIELSEFENIKIMVIARPRGQTVIVDKPGLNFNSITNKNVKLFMPRDAFPSRTEVRLVVSIL
ncbi:eukaryotic translation initiation factor 5B-like [Mya arenaria]|uniref:eukaryotic translation initiation factor 5B-like n=1 Tax=Mya arenaria TaxID=6604 RepID=UPI0022E354AA|nr:eukaryotic translation initiation factor 5B-like [Mya arenaria]